MQNRDIKTFKNEILEEVTYKTTLKNGLDIYINKREGFEKKIALFGTKYGSITNKFISVDTNKEVKVPDGIAHFLEHKLFEQEGENALDLFSKEGISCNAYTSFDQTVYYFETTDKFKKGLEMLIKLVKTPHFTDENVEKEQGIIAQEIAMYENEPEYVSYFNSLRAMYNNHPVRIDIAGTKESISNITKEYLYTCYNTFYHPSNMFMVIVGNVDVEDTINLIESDLQKYENNIQKTVITKFTTDEPENICETEIKTKLNVYMPQITLGYKLKLYSKEEIIKRQIISEIIGEMYFSKNSKFYEEQYSLGNINEEIGFSYEGANEFSHVIISTASNNYEILIKEIESYIEELKCTDIDLELFEKIKRKKIGETIMLSESQNVIYRRIVESILVGNELYADIDYVYNIKSEDVKQFLLELDKGKFVRSIVI